VTRERARDDYFTWLWGEILLFGLLGASLALFATNASLRTTYELPELRLVIATSIGLAGAIVAILAGARFAVEGRRSDLLLSNGFFVGAASTLAFAVAPVFDRDPVGRREAWAAVGGHLLAMSLIAAAPFVAGRVLSRARALRTAVGLCAAFLVALWSLLSWGTPVLPELGPQGDLSPPILLTLSLALLSLLNLVALVGFGLRFRREQVDLDRWLALGATFLLFGSLYLVFTPLVAASEVSFADFLRVLGYAVLLVGVWRAIRAAEFGRAVAEERARVAREIHDGLAQYLFAVSTHASMLGSGAPLEQTLPRLKEAAAAAQQEARFAVLALSSASGTAPFDAALRRYVEFLCADGGLNVELEIDPATELAPDEQIEVFRIVQEGLANARRHSSATRAEVHIGQRGGRRVVEVRDDGSGFDGREAAAGQGLKNIRLRAASIGGLFAIHSQPGLGTALEITLRA
jgi:signal transduction histidine kinase